jgi:hypothetical protein
MHQDPKHSDADQQRWQQLQRTTEDQILPFPREPGDIDWHSHDKSHKYKHCKSSTRQLQIQEKRRKQDLRA